MQYFKDLKTSELYAYEDNIGAAKIKPGLIAITPEEYMSIVVDPLRSIPVTTETTKTYIDERVLQYPSIQDQLDMQYHDLINGTTVWKDLITLIKTQIPKTELSPPVNLPATLSLG